MAAGNAPDVARDAEVVKARASLAETMRRYLRHADGFTADATLWQDEHEMTHMEANDLPAALREVIGSMQDFYTRHPRGVVEI